MNNLQYRLAQLGSREARQRTISMLPAPSDLPGGSWRVLDQKTWRTGAWGSISSDEGQRAHQIGTYSSIRTFVQGEFPRWFYVLVIPCASASDAISAIPLAKSRMSNHRSSDVKIIEEHIAREVQIDEMPDSLIFEQRTVGRLGPGIARYVAGNVDEVAFVICCSSLEDGWPWDEVAELAMRQTATIRSV
jgi:hypothetical protein